jgi:hypothetical protein
MGGGLDRHSNSLGNRVIDRPSTATASGSGLKLHLELSACSRGEQVDRERAEVALLSYETSLFSLQSLESTRCRDNHLALMFSTPGRCPAWMENFLRIHHSHNSTARLERGRE